MTELQLEPSAQAPWTNTTVGDRPLGGMRSPLQGFVLRFLHTKVVEQLYGKSEDHVRTTGNQTRTDISAARYG